MNQIIRRLLVGGLLAAMTASSFSGCASAPQPAASTLAASAASSSAVSAPASSASEASSSADAHLSGKLVIYSAGPSQLIQNITAGFQAKTGLKADVFSSTTGKILSRVEAEKSNPQADVLILASLSSAIGLKKEGITEPYANAKNADKMVSDWKDAENNYFCYSGSALCIVYNTKLVENPPKDWSDLTAPQYKNQLMMPDPTSSGSCMDFVTGYVNKNGDKAWSYFQDLKNNGMKIANSNDTALQPVLTGSKSIVVSGVDYMTLADKKKGEPVDVVYPSSGTVISPRPALIVKGSKNETNAQAFIDYLLSDEAQKMVADAYLLPGRSDVSVEGKKSAKDITSLDVDWTWMAGNSKPVGSKFDKIFGVK